MRSSCLPFASRIGLVAMLLAAGCSGIERTANPNALGDAGTKDQGPPGSCNNCSGKCCLNKCVDVKTDVHNCGACESACDPGMQCIGGICQCAGAGGQGAKTCAHGEACCDGKCIAIMSDAVNCGNCASAGGKDCTMAMETCIMGQCGCGTAGSHCAPMDEMCCGSTCPNVMDDPMNCGACGNTCAANQTCTGGKCTGGGGGGCNPPCMAPLMCVGGMCTIGGGGICMSDNDCQNGQKCVFILPGIPIGLCM